MICEWISVADGLPEHGGSYLVCTDTSNVFSAHYYIAGRRWSARRTVTHWMPMPEAAKEEPSDKR